MTLDPEHLRTSPPVVLHQWSARKMRPIILLFATTTFVAFMALAHFALHSMTAVKALALGAVAFIVPLVPSVLSRLEYRLTEAGLDRRSPRQKEAGEFQEVFRWGEISHVVPMKHGFKYFKSAGGGNPLRRWWRTHLSDAYSGEVHWEVADKEEVLRVISDRRIPTTKVARLR